MIGKCTWSVISTVIIETERISRGHRQSRALIPRLHDTTDCQSGCTTGLTTVLNEQPLKWNKSLLTFNVWLHYFDCCSTFVQRLLVCVCVCVCVCFSLCVIIVFFSDCRIYLFSSLAARVFTKLTRYSTVFVRCLLSNTSILHVLSVLLHSTAASAALDRAPCCRRRFICIGGEEN